MMVRETRIIFEPGDIRKLRAVCRKCGGEVDLPFRARYKPPPSDCPHCRTTWYNPGVEDPTVEAMLNLLQDAHRLATSKDTIPFTARFEIEDDS